MSQLLFPPWFAKHMLGALDVLPNVSGASLSTVEKPLVHGAKGGTWMSRDVHDLTSRSARVSRPFFDLPPRQPDAEKRGKEVEGSLKHRTINMRVRLLDFKHEYESGKRKFETILQPEKATVNRSAKDVQQMLNQCAGAARFVYNKALDFIRRQPREQQASWYKVSRLNPILLSQRKYKDRELQPQASDETAVAYAKRISGLKTSQSQSRYRKHISSSDQRAACVGVYRSCNVL